MITSLATSMFVGHVEGSFFTPVWSKPSQVNQALTVMSEENCAYGKINAGAGEQVSLCSASWLQRWRGGAVLLFPLNFWVPLPGAERSGDMLWSCQVCVMDIWVSSPGERKTKGGTSHYAVSLAPQEEIVCLVTSTWKLDSSSYHNLQL